jgi:hypothetical protein
MSEYVGTQRIEEVTRARAIEIKEPSGKAKKRVTTRKEIPQSSDPITESFKAKRSVGLFKKEEWDITVKHDSIQFSSAGSGECISVSRDEAKDRIEFPRECTLFSGGIVHVKQDGKVYQFVLGSAGKSRLRSWLPKKTLPELKNELRKWGIGLIVLGGIHLLLTGFLDPLWGLVIACIGVLNLLVPRRGMFIMNGIALLLAGVLNMSAGGGWKIFGMLQIVWGVQEIRKLKEYE